MKTLHKLILKSFLGPMIMTFFIIIFILMMNFVWRYIEDLVGKGLDPLVIIELLMYATINMIQMGLPLAVLLATIMTMGDLGENFELLAMKTAGLSMMRIIRPLIAVIAVISVCSFFIINNLVPYSNQKMFAIISDINSQNQALEFQDGIFFNGIDGMSIRVEHQDPDTKLLSKVLIYDNTAISGDMNTTIADSGRIRLSDDKRFLLVTLYNGQTYEQTRSSNWFNKSSLRHHTFDVQEGKIPVDGFAFERSESKDFSGQSATMNINELQNAIDSLKNQIHDVTETGYMPLLRGQIFLKDPNELYPDSMADDRSRRVCSALLTDSIDKMTIRDKALMYESAHRSVRSARSSFSFDESTSKEVLNQLYRAKNEWHRKLALPISILIFFLVGAPLGAIIRKGGLGMPIVISVIFFVIYYVISISGEKLSKEGTLPSYIGMWVSSIILTPVAIYLTYKATNDSAVFDLDWYRNHFKRAGVWISSVTPEPVKNSLSALSARLQKKNRK